MSFPFVYKSVTYHKKGVLYAIVLDVVKEACILIDSKTEHHISGIIKITQCRDIEK